MRSARFRPEAVGAPRWRGCSGRLEVWYLTATEPVTGTGLWIHGEVVAPTDRSDARGHGWIALFPPDAAPVWRRFGPTRVDPHQGEDAPWFEAGGALFTAGRITGRADDASWSLTTRGAAPPLWTFPEWAWERELLPGAQVVAAPTMGVTGPVRIGSHEIHLDDAPGALARIYGHGNAERWAWLHADLGEGDVLEIVSGVSRRPVLRRLPPAPFVRLRLNGRDLPRIPISPGKTHLALPAWSLTALAGTRRLRVQVDIPPERAVQIGYVDPDGATATCTNSERADAEIVLERFSGRWRTERNWLLAGTAHSEVGLRP